MVEILYNLISVFFSIIRGVSRVDEKINKIRRVVSGDCAGRRLKLYFCYKTFQEASNENIKIYYR